MASIKNIKRDSRVEIVDDERSIGNGVIVTLRQGYSFDPMMDNRVRGEDTVHEMDVTMKGGVYRFDGPYND